MEEKKAKRKAEKEMHALTNEEKELAKEEARAKKEVEYEQYVQDFEEK